MIGEKNKVIVISAPSGAGKTTIVKHLLSRFKNLAFSISATTRKMRENEIDGADYYFLKADDFQKHIQNNDFIEWEMVYEGKYYGTLKSEINRIWKINKIPLLEVDVKGAIRLKEEFENSNVVVVAIFIQIPSISVLKNRLINRGTEDEKSIEARIKKAQYELEFVSHFDYVIENKHLETCLQEVEKTIGSIL